MARKFDKSSAFKSIVGADQDNAAPDTAEAIDAPVAEQPTPAESPAAPSSFQVTRPSKKNVRNHHLHILVTPTLAKKIDQKCKQIGVSRNEAINQLIEEFVK